MSTEYSEKLRDPRWQKVRLKVLERDGWKCLNCGDDKESLQIHHLRYSSGDPWDTPEKDLETLCSTCHYRREEINKFLGDRSHVNTEAFLSWFDWLEPMLCGKKPVWDGGPPAIRGYLQDQVDSCDRVIAKKAAQNNSANKGGKL